MSPRAAVTRTITRCGCGRPTRDGAFVCAGCLVELADDLRELVRTSSDRPVPQNVRHLELVRATPTNPDRELWVAWCPFPRPTEIVPSLWDELADTIAGERGVDYRSLGGATGGGKATGLVLNEAAARAAHRLVAVLRDVVRIHLDRVQLAGRRAGKATVRSWFDPQQVPDVAGMAAWLLERVDALAWLPAAATVPSRVHDAVKAAQRAVAPPSPGQDLGPCLVEGCRGRLVAPDDQPFATCDVCGSWIEAQVVRDWLIDDLRDQLLTAAEITDRAMYLGLRGDREQVRKRINQWSSRGRIGGVCAWSPGVCPWPLRTAALYRFGDVYDLLLDAEQRDFPLTKETHR